MRRSSPSAVEKQWILDVNDDVNREAQVKRASRAPQSLQNVLPSIDPHPSTCDTPIMSKIDVSNPATVPKRKNPRPD
uniref:Uncharacterized protein n=1 Tax=Knipowitschia caucasica TaxID=637954 RepID=A0AAV2KKV4_KNICA